MAKQLKRSQIESVTKQLVARQGGRCAVCGRPFTRTDGTCLDHDHETGYIRGVLHRSCNGIEGKVKTLARRSHKGVSSYEFIIGLGKYLEKHSTPQLPYIHPEHVTEDMKREMRNKKAREARARKREASKNT